MRQEREGRGGEERAEEIQWFEGRVGLVLSKPKLAHQSVSSFSYPVYIHTHARTSVFWAMRLVTCADCMRGLGVQL